MGCLVSAQNYVSGNCLPAEIDSTYSASQRLCTYKIKLIHDCRNALTNDDMTSAYHFIEITIQLFITPQINAVVFILLQRIKN